MKKWLIFALLASSVPFALTGCEDGGSDDPSVNATGYWRGYSFEGFYTEVRLQLTQAADGSVSGTANALNIVGYPMTGNPCSGQVLDDTVCLHVDLKDSDEEDYVEGYVNGNEMRGVWQSAEKGTIKFVATLQ